MQPNQPENFPLPFQPGRYDDLCSYVREAAKASSVIVAVIDGQHGPGFSIQTSDPLRMAVVLPAALRAIAIALELEHGDGSEETNALTALAQLLTLMSEEELIRLRHRARLSHNRWLAAIITSQLEVLAIHHGGEN